MKSTRALKATGLVLIAVVLGLLAVQGSYAVWNKSVSATAGTVQAADFQVSLTDIASQRQTDMTLADGTAATLALSTTPIGTVIPGQSSYAAVQLGNKSDAGGDFTILATTAAPVITNGAGSQLAQYLELKVVAAPSMAQCNAETFNAGPANSGTAEINIPKTGTGAFCFQVTLAANMPAALSGQTATVAVPITVTQI